MNQEQLNLNPRYEVISVTPDMASSWLASDTNFQRNLSTKRVKDYEAMMRKGEWMVTHQAIGIDEQGRVVDGQHRLTAVVSSGLTVPMTVAFGVDPETFRALDRGFIRSYDQLAKIAGLEWANSNVIAGAHSLLWRPSVPSSTNKKWSFQDLEDVLEFFKDDLLTVYPTSLSGHNHLRQAAVRGAALRGLVSGVVPRARVSDFIYCIATGLPTEHGGTGDNAALAFRNHMMQAGNSRTKHMKIATFCVALRALHLFAEGKMLKHTTNLVTYREDVKYEWFPTFIDNMPSYLAFGEFAKAA